MMRLIILVLSLYFSVLTLAGEPRTPRFYFSSGDAVEDRNLCRKRFVDELAYTQKNLAPRCKTAETISLMTTIESMLNNGDALNDIAQRYQTLLGSLAQCRMSYLLHDGVQEEGSNERIKNITLHVLGDDFGKGTGLEGGNAEHMLQHRIRQLKRLLDTMNKYAFINDIDQAQPCFRLPQQNTGIVDSVLPMTDLSSSLLRKLIAQHENALRLLKLSLRPKPDFFRTGLATQLRKLKVGRLLFFPINWSKHTLSLLLIRTDDKHVTLKVFNTGEGVETYHDLVLYGHERRYRSYMQRVRVPIAALTSRVAITALREILVPDGRSTGPLDFYDRFLLALGDEEKLPSVETDMLAQPQNSGTCSYRSFPHVTRAIARELRGTHEGDRDAARIELLIDALTLNDYGNWLTARMNSHDEQGWNLLTKSTVTFSSAVAKRVAKIELTNDEAQPIVERIRNLKLQTQSIEGLGRALDVPSPFVYSLPTASEFPRETSLSARFILQSFKKSAPPLTPSEAIVLNTSTAIVDKSSVNVLLTELVNTSRLASTERQHLAVMHQVSAVAAELPLRHTFWQHTEEADALKKISLLRELGERYVFSFLRTIATGVHPKMEISTTQLMVVIKLLSVADMLNQKFVQSVDPKIPSLYSPMFGDLFRDSSVVHIEDATWQEQFAALRNYFAAAHVHEDFFALTSIPVGAGYTPRIFEEDIAAGEVQHLAPKETKWEDKVRLPYFEWAYALAKIAKANNENYFTVLEQNWPHYKFTWQPRRSFAEERTDILLNREPSPRMSDDIVLRRAALKFLSTWDKLPALKNQLRLFHDLRALAVLVNYLLTANLSGENFESDKNAALGLQFEKSRGEVLVRESVGRTENADEIKSTSFNFAKVQVNFFGVRSHKISSSYQDKPTCIDAGGKDAFTYRAPFVHLDAAHGEFSMLAPGAKNNFLLTLFSTKPVEGARGIHQPPRRLRLATNALIATSPRSQNVIGLSHEHMRAVLHLSAKRELQLDKTLAYFSRNNHLFALAEPDYRTLFRKLMFEPSLLHDELSINPRHGRDFARRLAQFSRDIFTRLKATTDYAGIAFILEMNELFRQHAGKHQFADGEFLDSPTLLRDVINNIDVHKMEERSFLFARLASIVASRPHLNNGDVATLLVAAIEHKHVRVVSKPWSEELARFSTRDVLLLRQQDILRALVQGKDEILSRVLAALRPEMTHELDSSWRVKSSSVFSTNHDGKNFSIDVLRGVLIVDESTIVSLPVDTKKYQFAFALNAHPPKSVRMIGDDAYEWIDDVSGDAIRALMQNTRLYLQRFHDGVWLEKILASSAIIPGHHTWMGSTNLDGVTPVLMTGIRTGAINYRAEYRENILASVERLRDESQLRPIAGDSAYKLFTALDKENNIYVWQRNDFVEVELPRLGLVFRSLDDKTGFDCAHFAGYKIASNQFHPRLKSPVTYLICDARDAKSKLKPLVLMAVKKFTAQQKTSSLLKENFTCDTDISKEEIVGLMTYVIVDDNTLEPTNKAAQFYLALRDLWQQRYHQSQELLMGSPLEDVRYAPHETEILKWITRGNTDDHDTRSFVIRLSAYFLLGKSSRFYGNDEEMQKDFKEMFVDDNRSVKLYFKYLQKVNSLGTSWMNNSDEQNLIEWFLNASSGAPWDKKFLLNLNQREQLVARKAYLKKLGELTDRAITIKLVPNYFGMRSTLSDVDHHNLSVYNFSKHLSAQSKNQQPSRGKILTNAVDNLNKDTFPYFYHVAQRLPFNNQTRNAAKQIFKNALGLTIITLNDEELQQELLALLQFSALKHLDTRPAIARMLVAISEQNDEERSVWKKLPWTKGTGRISLQEMVDANIIGRPGIGEKKFSHAVAALRSPIEEATPPLTFITKMSKALKIEEVVLVKYRSSVLDDVPISQSSFDDPLTSPLMATTRITEIFGEIVDAETPAQFTAWGDKLSTTLNGAASSGKVSRDVSTAVSDLVAKLAVEQNKMSHLKAYRVINKRELQSEIVAIEAQLVDVDQKLVKDKRKIEAVANHYDGAMPDANFNELLKLADVEVDAEIHHLAYLLLTNTLNDFFCINGCMTQKTSQKLRESIINYLLLSTYRDQLARAHEKLARVDETIGNALEESQAIIEALTVLTSTRAYVVADHLEYLVFEFFIDKLLRPHQTLALDALGIKNGRISNNKMLGRVMELIMGFGKSSLIAPLLCALNSNGAWLNVVVFPENLIASMASELSSTLYRGFNKHVDVMLFGHEHTSGPRAIKILRERMESAQKNGRTVVTTNSGVQGLVLTFLALLETATQSEDDSRSIAELAKIFRLWKDVGVVTIDEVDLAFDVLRAQQIATGPRVAIAEILKDTVASFYGLIATDPAIHQVFQLPFLSYSHGTPLTDQEMPALKRVLVDKLSSLTRNKQSFLHHRADLNAGFKALLADKSIREKIIVYWQDFTPESRRAAFADIAEPAMKDVVAIIAEELNIAFPITAQKKVFIHYGPLPAPTPLGRAHEQSSHDKNLQSESALSRFVAIPYLEGNALVQSRFARAIEAANYTTQKDLSINDFTAYVKLELDALKKCPRGDVNFHYRYQKLAGIFSAMRIDELGDKEIAGIARAKADGPVVEKMRLIRSYALAMVSTFARQLHTNSFIYEFLFHMVDGLSGELWNEKTFPDIFADAIFSNTSPYTILLLLARAGETRTIVPGNLSELVAQIYGGWQNPGSFIDDAGILKGFANEVVAHEMLQFTTGGVIFYDDKNYLMFMEKTGKVVPLEQTAVPVEQRIAYLDKLHTTGANVKLAPFMQARVSVDAHTRLRDLEQSAWRLRGLDQAQRINAFVMLKNDREIVEEKLRKKFAMSFTPEHPLDLVAFTILNQFEELSTLSWRSCEYRLANRLVSAAFETILQRASNLDYGTMSAARLASAAFKESRSLFAHDETTELFTVYGIPASVTDTKTAIENKIAALKNEPSYLTFNIDGIIDTEWQAIIDKTIQDLPDVVMATSAAVNTDVRITLNTKIKTNTQTQTQTSTTLTDAQQHVPQAEVKSWQLLADHEQVFSEDFVRRHDLSLSTEVIASSAAMLGYNRLTPLFTHLSSDILFSENFAPISDGGFKFFSFHEKQLGDVLIIYHKAQKTFSLVALDLDDAQEWRTLLMHDQISPSDGARDVIIAIYNILDDALSAQSFERFDDDVLRHDPAFLQLLVQAKFMAGHVSFADHEKIYLKRWLDDSHDSAALREIFIGTILSHKDDTQKRYEVSNLAEIFDSDER